MNSVEESSGFKRDFSACILIQSSQNRECTVQCIYTVYSLKHSMLHLKIGIIYYGNVRVLSSVLVCVCVHTCVRVITRVPCQWKGREGPQTCQRGQQGADRGDTGGGLWWHLHSGNRPSQHNDEQGPLLLRKTRRRMWCEQRDGLTSTCSHSTVLLYMHKLKYTALSMEYSLFLPDLDWIKWE